VQCSIAVILPHIAPRREPRGIAFIEFAETRDAEDALHGLDRKYLEGREVRRRPHTRNRAACLSA